MLLLVGWLLTNQPESVRAIDEVLKEDFDARWESNDEDVFRPAII